MNDQSSTDNDDDVTPSQIIKSYNPENYVRNKNKLARLHGELYTIKKGNGVKKKETVGIPCK